MHNFPILDLRLFLMFLKKYVCHINVYPEFFYV